VIYGSTDPPEQLQVDLSAPPPVSDADVRAWAGEHRVFVSSVMSGMSAERMAAVRAITATGATPVYFEAFGGMDDDPEGAYTALVASSDIYLGILGARYGKPLTSGYSATHAEYNAAIASGLRISIWTTGADQDGHQRDFLDEVRVFHTTGTYSSPDDLAEEFERRLRAIAADALAPWVKIGNTIFRAISIHDDGRTIRVVSRVRDNAVAASLEARRPDTPYRRSSETRITWSGGTSPTRITRVESETTTSRERKMTITADRTQEHRSNLLDVGINNATPDELTELAARVAFLGEANPLDVMSFMVSGSNPLQVLEMLGLPEDAMEQVALLLVIETLVGERGVDHIASFRLGPRHLGQRQLRIAWMPRARYTNVLPVERSIQGMVVVAP